MGNLAYAYADVIPEIPCAAIFERPSSVKHKKQRVEEDDFENSGLRDGSGCENKSCEK